MRRAKEQVSPALLQSNAEEDGALHKANHTSSSTEGTGHGSEV